MCFILITSTSCNLSLSTKYPTVTSIIYSFSYQIPTGNEACKDWPIVVMCYAAVLSKFTCYAQYCAQ